MWLLKKRIGKQCEGVRDALERTTEQREAGEIVALGALLARLPERGRKHASECSDCRTFAEELLEVHGMFESAENGARPGPYFLARVMAAIADREMELEKSAQTWAAVPRRSPLRAGKTHLCPARAATRARPVQPMRRRATPSALSTPPRARIPPATARTAAISRPRSRPS